MLQTHHSFTIVAISQSLESETSFSTQRQGVQQLKRAHMNSYENRPSERIILPEATGLFAQAMQYRTHYICHQSITFWNCLCCWGQPHSLSPILFTPTFPKGFPGLVHISNQIYTEALQSIPLAQPRRNKLWKRSRHSLDKLCWSKTCSFKTSQVSPTAIAQQAQKSRLPPRTMQFFQLPSCMWSLYLSK